MPLPITQLDDRRFDDLVAEARQRLVSQLPELTQVVEGDPLYAITDLMAWMTETIIYRANLIPERQRQAFLNLLQIPLRPAQPARGLVAIHSSSKRAQLPALLPEANRLSAGKVIVSTRGELQPTPLALRLMIKERLGASELNAMGVTLDQLRQLYQFGAQTASPFRPRSFNLGSDTLNLQQSLDKKYYLLLHLNDKKLVAHKDKLRAQLAGKVLNIGLAPVTDLPAEIARELPPRRLRWQLLWQPAADSQRAELLPLEVLHDSSRGARESGVVRLKIPTNFQTFNSEFTQDPKYAGMNNTPPEAPVDVDPNTIIAWLCLSAPDDPEFALGFMAVNAVDVVAQELVLDQVIGQGDGRAGQVVSLGRSDVEAASLQLEVSENGIYRPWQQLANFSGASLNDRVYQFDASTGSVIFGDGIRGKRPAPGERIRAARFHAGGGASGNLPAGSVRQLLSGSAAELQVQQDWPLSGGQEAESVAQAEQRIPAELRHRDRAVTREDFIQLAQDNPLVPVGRAELIPGLMPGNSPAAIQTDVPGVVSLLVMPPAEPALGAAPRPSAGLLNDLFRYLAPRTLLGTELYVLSPQFVPVALSLSLEVMDRSNLTSILQAVEKNLLASLWPLAPGGFNGTGWPLGRELDVNELRTLAGRTPGVLAINELQLYYQQPSGSWQTLPKLRLEAWQLPELAEVHIEEGEQVPAPPQRVVQAPPESGIAVPVIPDFC
jgi:hypothetical protein